MTPIDVCLFREIKPDLESKLIMWWTKSPASHIGFVYQALDGKWKIYHAVGKGVCIEDYEEFMKEHVRVGVKTVNLNCCPAIWDRHTKSNTDRPYSSSQFFIFLLPWKWSKKWFSNGRAMFVCSELVATDLIEFAGIKFPKGVEELTPLEVFNAL